MSKASFKAEVPPDFYVVLGLGASGQAVVRYLQHQKHAFMLVDTRAQPPDLATLKALAPEAPVYLGDLTQLDMHPAKEVIISPGLDPHHPALQAQNIRPIGEIELFCRARPLDVPLIAITGSNAKSSVTTWVAEMARLSGLNVAVGGNLGTPALDLLTPKPDVFVLELSSFQLETTSALNAEIACFLNLSEDHLDRHQSMEAYRQIKQRIFIGARWAVTNADDPATWPTTPLAQTQFTLKPNNQIAWHILETQGHRWLAHGAQQWLSVNELQVAGEHNLANALASMAIAQLMHWPKMAIIQALRTFQGLAHRCEVIATIQGVRYINDSKGTNVAASLAAIEGLGATGPGKLIWLGGGLGKAADFTPLIEPLKQFARVALLFGRDASLIEAVLKDHLPTEILEDMSSALERAQHWAKPGDTVLLSPACASMDQFQNYEARGDAFKQWVQTAANTMSSV